MHANVESVGLCRSCGRFLCRDCIQFAGRRLACKGACASEIDAIYANVESSYRTMRGMYVASVVVLAAAALLGLGGAIFDDPRHRAFGFGSAALFAALAAWRFVR